MSGSKKFFQKGAIAEASMLLADCPLLSPKQQCQCTAKGLYNFIQI